MNKVLIVFFLFIVTSLSCFSQNESEGLVKWLDFKEAQQKNKVAQRPLLIDFYTDWCGWCKHMMKTTYSNPALAGYINNNFYPVKFNAETKDTIEYNGKIYKPISKEPRTPHELTIKFLGNSLSYPSTAFVTNNYEYSLLTQGFLEDKKIEPILIFMLENAWRTGIYDEFNKHFGHTFYDTNFAKGPVKTYSIEELEKIQKKKPKKVLVNFSSSFCNTCKVMEKTTFRDSSVAGYINDNFYLVNFNVETNDTILFKNEKYFKSLVNNFPMNSLSLKLAANRFSLPAICVLDEQLNTIEVLNYYQSPEHIKPILHYIADNAYKTKNFPEFMKTYTDKAQQPAKASPKTKKK
jgi:thioredoxin-related protein